MGDQAGVGAVLLVERRVQVVEEGVEEGVMKEVEEGGGRISDAGAIVVVAGMVVVLAIEMGCHHSPIYSN